MKDTGQLPPERRLSSRRRDEILRSVLNVEEPRAPKQRWHRTRWIAPAAAGGAAALIAVGVVIVTDGGPSAGPAPSGSATQPTDGRVPLDLGPLPAAEARDRLSDCLSSLGMLRGGLDEADYKIHLAGWMDDFYQDPVPAIVATVTEKHRYGGKPYLTYCTGFSDAAGPIQRFYREPDAKHPVVRYDSDFHQGRPWMDSWFIQSFYRVADTVDRVEVRVGTRGGPEPWRVARPHDGFVYWAAWITDNPYSPDDKVWLQWRAYDTNGHLIDPELMPDKDRLLPMSPPQSAG